MQYRLFQRSSVWFIDIRDERFEGGRLKKSLRTRDRPEAQRLASQIIAKFSPQAIGYKALGAALTDVANSKNKTATIASYLAKVKPLTRVLGEEFNLLTLDDETVGAYISTRRDGKVSDHTIHKELSLLRQTWASYCPGRPNPVPKFSASYKPRKRFLTVTEAAKLLRAANRSQFAPWLWMALYAGCEVGALVRMDWGSIDFEMGQIHVLGTKAETRDRYVPLSADLRAYLETLDKDAPLLCRWPSAQRWRQMNTWCTKSGVGHVSMTDLRRTFGSWLKQAGVDSKRIADLMGHTSTIMVDRVYGQLDAKAYRDAVAQLPSLPKLVVV